MKKLLYIALVGSLSLASCQKNFINLSPQSSITDAAYFKQPSDFKAYTTSFYGELMGWQSPYGGNDVYNHMDVATDLSTYFAFSSDESRGTLTIPTSDNRWDNSYGWIRSANILLAKAAAYTGSQSSIAQYVSEAYFFRANAYYQLLKVFGGVPIVTTVLDVNSPELFGPRNSRYEVVTQILSDLDNAIANLPIEQNIPSTDKGRISKWAAEAFKAEVELYEGTWRKYNGTSTDFAGSAGPTSDQKNQFFTDAAALSLDVMTNGGYALWNYNSNPAMLNQSYTYLFNLEDAGSNPAGLTKASNNEFILYGVYDFTLRPGGQNLSFTAYMMTPSRKMMDMFLCTDGLPPSVSPLFKGYHNVGDEYQNRDLRLLGYIGATPTTVNLNLGGPGYGDIKFASYNYGTYRNADQESPNFPIIRLAEVYLIYAEASFEANGSITDAQLDASINLIRDRAGIAHLSNALVTTNGLDMLTEIRRERTLELYHEGFRFDDLKRWGIAEASLNASICGEVVGNGSYPTAFRTATGAATSYYVPNTYVWGEEAVPTAAGTLNCVVIDSKTNRNFTKKDYLWPLPQQQINLAPKLKQNPGY
ncbi:RagB/SusD family nutrient uptake outer membrane protein [Mucilaginibacter sp. L196]|uniref:RagB/SusD family nutrient uptake outer membrane protein n=1 Tax=Mucilaginibacter sp. L196 TaxID=1641870 RepID=UPI00131D8916|nr:RagB/SusD family nutrient uptake outer membrane protein [Mucilaginibacter sp. L196]